MSDLVNPFVETVVFGKAYPVAWPPPGAKVLTAIVPTGRHVSHANDLHHTHNASGHGGRATRLEHYGRKKVSKGSVSEGLRMAASQKGVMPRMNTAGTKSVGSELSRRLRLARTTQARRAS